LGVLLLAIVATILFAVREAIPPDSKSIINYSLIALAVAGLVIILRPIIKYFMSQFVITNKRIVIKHGLLARRSYEMLLNKIESINVDQSLTDRLLWGAGTLVITGTGGSKEIFDEVGRAIKFQRKLNEVLHA